MNKPNLFIIKSPLQMINAVEAISYFNLENNILLVVNNGVINNSKQMKKLFFLHKWKQIINMEDTKKSKFFRYLKLIKELKKSKYNHIFIGDLGNITKAIIANTIKNKVFYLDDGVATYNDYNKFIKLNKINKYNLKELRYLLFGFKIKIKDKINMFSYFDLEPSDRIIIKNNFTYFKKNYLNKLIETKDIYFLGQPSHLMDSLETYEKFIKAIIQRYPNNKIIYMPHRTESEQQRLCIKSLQNDLFEFRDNTIPIEMYFMENKILPSNIISFCSSALSTLEVIYDIPYIYSVEIPKTLFNHTLNNYDTGLKNYYKELDKNKLIKFDDLGYDKV